MKRKEIFKKEKRKEKKSGVNLAPMVDITLSLLIMFILSTPFIMESGIFVQRAAAGKAAKKVVRRVRKEKTKINIYISADGTLYLNQEPITVDSLQKLVPELLKRSRDKNAVVSADSIVEYATVIHIIDLVKQLGAENVLILKRRGVPKFVKRRRGR